MLSGWRAVPACVCVILLATAVAGAQTIPLTSPDGRKQTTAMRLTGTVTLDGDLNEDAWASAPAATGFVQAEPQEGEPATESTEVRILFDEDHLYIGVRCLDRGP